MTLHDTASEQSELRALAVQRLKKQRDFKAHVLVYVLVNAFIVLIWVMTNSGSFFWPAFPIGFWGIGVVMNGWDAYRHEAFTETEIRREMERLQHR